MGQQCAGFGIVRSCNRGPLVAIAALTIATLWETAFAVAIAKIMFYCASIPRIIRNLHDEPRCSLC